MICVEVPVKSIQIEITKLAMADGPFSELYAKGAVDALTWILAGSPPPSEGGVTNFPVTFDADRNVH